MYPISAQCVIRHVLCCILGLTHVPICDKQVLCYDMNFQVYWIHDSVWIHLLIDLYSQSRIFPSHPASTCRDERFNHSRSIDGVFFMSEIYCVSYCMCFSSLGQEKKFIAH